MESKKWDFYVVLYATILASCRVGWQLWVGVTRLGEFSPIGQLFTLCSFFEIIEL
jgi:hypothetical protein